MLGPQWKMRVVMVRTRPTGPDGAGPDRISTMVMVSPVSSASTCKAVLPSSIFQLLTTRHFWAGLPPSWTVMIRSAGRAEVAGGASAG